MFYLCSKVEIMPLARLIDNLMALDFFFDFALKNLKILPRALADGMWEWMTFYELRVIANC